MRFLILNGSPRKNGNVVKALKKQVQNYSEKLEKKDTKIQTVWLDINDLNFDFCKGCMSCRSKKTCILKEDDAHKVAKEIELCDYIFIGTPVNWANMNGKLKSLFDRLVATFMAENLNGIPKPLQKGKKGIIVTSCTTPFPFNYLCHQTTGAVKSVKEVLKTAGFKIIKTVNLSGTKK